MIGLFSEEIMRLISVILIGQYSDINNLAALAIGNMTIIIVIRSVSFGYVSCLTSLVSNAYNAREYYLCGLHINRALLVNTLIFIIQVFILVFTRPLLEILKQEEDVIMLAEKYIFWMLPGLY